MDFHCHIDLYPNAREVYKNASKRNAFTWLVTTSPRAYAATTSALTPESNILITPGLHPEIAHERADELELMLNQIVLAEAVGEVGLDGSRRFRTGYKVQRMIFSAVVEKCQRLGGRVLSIHSRQAVMDVLAELKRCPHFGIGVLHWFSGSAAELKAAGSFGCWFSVGPAMFATDSGRTIISKLPRDHVVPESDGPFAKFEGEIVMPWSADLTAKLLSQVWKTNELEATAILEANSIRLLNLMGRPKLPINVAPKGL